MEAAEPGSQELDSARTSSSSPQLLLGGGGGLEPSEGTLCSPWGREMAGRLGRAGAMVVVGKPKLQA